MIVCDHLAKINRLSSTELASFQKANKNLIDSSKQFTDNLCYSDYFREQLHKEKITHKNCKGTSHYSMKMIEQFQCKTCRTHIPI